MPLIKIQTSHTAEPPVQDALMKTLSREVVDILGKPEQYMMVVFEKASLIMGGHDAPAALIQVRSIGGLSPDINRKLSDTISRILNSELGLPKERIYINFIEFERADWGWNGSTFG